MRKLLINLGASEEVRLICAEYPLGANLALRSLGQPAQLDQHVMGGRLAPQPVALRAQREVEGHPQNTQSKHVI